MEVAQYGDTEIAASELKTTIEKLKHCDKEGAKSKMEDDFEVNQFYELTLYNTTISYCRTLKTLSKTENHVP